MICGRRIEGWRGLLPVSAPAAEVPREKERTRQVAPSPDLLLSAAGMLDKESMRPTRELPSIGHELRAQSPGHRVLTSPTGNVLPASFLEALADRTSAASDDDDPEEPTGVHRPLARPSGRPQDGAPVALMPDDKTDLVRPRRRAPPRVLAQLLLMSLVCALVAVSVSLLAYRLMVGPRPPPAPVLSQSQQPALAAPQPAPGSRRAQRGRGSYRTRDLVVSVAAPKRGPASQVPAFRAAAAVDLGAAPAGLAAAADLGAPDQTQPQTQTPEEAQREDEAQVAASDIEFVASNNNAQVRACYERSFKDVPAAGGRVELAFTLTEEGRAVDVTNPVNTTGSDALALCLAQRMQQWRFPRPVGGRKAYQFPFVFRGPGGTGP